ncbi:MAG: PD-(D/E)XK nuclease family protein [bacterium]
MDTYLKQIAHRIVTDHPQDTDRVLVVFNNNRSKRFFTKQFEGMGKAVFLPKVMAIDELITELGGLEIVPNEFLLFELYAIHVELGGTGRKYQTFEEFISFGDLMMSDFSEIDQYCVDARLIFDNLHSLKAIGEWDIGGTGLTEFQRKYLEFYRSLYEYYTRLHARLLAQGKAYGGMAYREVAERMEKGEMRREKGEGSGEKGEWEAVYFVGFNALSKCEEKIIGEFVRRGIGHLLADSDPYYLEPNQEAGYFLEKHMDDFPELRPTGPSLFGIGEKKVTLVDCPENILQCKYAGQLLAEHPEWLDPQEAESTAIVLADEGLLIPTLNALPDTGSNYNVNITMGYAFADSMVHALILKLFTLYQQHSQRGYYHSDLVEVLSDRFVSHLLDIPQLRHRAERILQRDNRIRCKGDEVVAMLGEAGATAPEKLRFLFPDADPSPTETLLILKQLAAEIVGCGILDSNRKEKQAVGSLVEVLDNMATLMEAYPYVENLETLERIYTRIAQRHSIALIGEPLSGLQILGMLETRNLDFKRVILLSANEGVLPSGRSDNTLIPHELKCHFGLPTYVEKDSVYAYHFYHLLQRAEKVYLLYSSESDGMGKGEASRFLRQVESELAPRFGIEVKYLTVKTDAALTHPTPQTEVTKGEAVMQRLKSMAQRGLSPTSFVDYIECPLKYYYARVLSIQETLDASEDLDASQLGDCIHKILENIYRPHLGQPLRAAILQDALDRLPTLMEEGFEELYAGGRNSEGRNRFLYSVAETQLRHILENELATLKRGSRLTVLQVEENIDGHTISDSVNLKGKIDRVDLLDGRLRIVDYKTGRLDKKEIAYSDGDEAMPGKWLQLMWYALLYCRKHHPTEAVTAGIYPLRNLRSDVKTATWNGSEEISPEQLESFETILRERTAELMDPTVPFVPTPSADACRYCPASTFCNFSFFFK